MRIPDELLRCVGFIGEAHSEDSAGRIQGDLLATGFFVAVPCESPKLNGYSTLYFVTAKHVASHLVDRPIYIVTNKRGGGRSDKWTTPDNQWWLHPTDETADVALMRVASNPEADTMSVALEHLGVPERLTRQHIGIGDEVFAVGLFSEAQNGERNQPILRHGNIAMMPTEQIQTELGYADIFLIEARSLGGISGSPVFAHNTLVSKVKLQDGSEAVMLANGAGMTLLGLVHGHWDIREAEINQPRFTQDRKRGVNYGMAMVVPAIKIFETLQRPELVAFRRETEERLLKGNAPGMDLAKPKESPETFTQSDFEASLIKATRKSK